MQRIFQRTRVRNTSALSADHYTGCLPNMQDKLSSVPAKVFRFPVDKQRVLGYYVKYRLNRASINPADSTSNPQPLSRIERPPPK